MKAGHESLHGLLLFVQLPVPPPAPPVPPPAAPVPPPAPEPEPLAPPLVPVPVPPPESVLLPAGGVPGVWSVDVFEPLLVPDWEPVERVPSLDAANVAAEATPNKPASNSDVNFLVIMVGLQKLSRYLMLVRRAGWLVPAG